MNVSPQEKQYEWCGAWIMKYVFDQVAKWFAISMVVLFLVAAVGITIVGGILLLFRLMDWWWIPAVIVAILMYHGLNVWDRDTRSES